MKKLIQGVISLLMLGASISAQATLIDRGNGMIYDSAQNITWLQDANYAKTSGYDTDGRMTWGQANTWANNLTFGGYSDWRLTNIVDQGRDGCNWGVSGTDCGYNVSTSGNELANLYYDTLGNTGYSLVHTSADGVNFLNLQFSAYWSGTEYAPDTDFAWRFNTFDGYQGNRYKDNSFYAWAVRSGDVASQAVPEPSILALFGLGLFGLAAGKRRV